MTTTFKLLGLPLEIRHQIYSYLLPDAADINMVRDDMDGPLKVNLLPVCQYIYYEVFQYYHFINTFVLDLSEPAYAPNRFVNGTKSILKYIRRAQNVHLVIGDPFITNDDSCAMFEYAREQLDWFFGALREANENRKGLWLRKLTVIDCREKTISKDITKDLLRRGDKRRQVLISLLEPFRNRIGPNLSIESRVQSRVHRYPEAPDTKGGFLAADIFALSDLTNSATGPTWDLVIGVDHMSPSVTIPYNHCNQSILS